MILKFKIERRDSDISIWYNFLFDDNNIKHANSYKFLYVFSKLNTKLCQRWSKRDL